MYYSNMYEEGGEAIKLKRSERVKIFDYKGHFLPACDAYTYTNGEKPSAEVRLGIGQQWRYMDSVNNVLISVRVMSCKALSHLGEVSSILYSHAFEIITS